MTLISTERWWAPAIPDMILQIQHLVWCTRPLDVNSGQVWQGVCHSLNHPGIVPAMANKNEAKGPWQCINIEK